MKQKRAPAPQSILSEEESIEHIRCFLKLLLLHSSSLLDRQEAEKHSFLRIAQQFSGEIINADSRQFYAGCDIGTAKIANQKWREFRIIICSVFAPE